MLSTNPKIARPGCRDVGQRRDRIGCFVIYRRAEQAVNLAPIEAGHAEIERQRFQVGDLRR